MVPPRRSSSSGAERDEELVQLPERLAQSLAEADALVGGILRRMELVQDQQRLAPFSSKVTVVTA